MHSAGDISLDKTMGSPAAGLKLLKLSLEGEYVPNYVVSGLFHDLKHEDFIAFLKKFSLGFVLTLVNNSTGLSHCP